MAASVNTNWKFSPCDRTRKSRLKNVASREKFRSGHPRDWLISEQPLILFTRSGLNDFRSHEINLLNNTSKSPDFNQLFLINSVMYNFKSSIRKLLRENTNAVSVIYKT